MRRVIVSGGIGVAYEVLLGVTRFLLTCGDYYVGASVVCRGCVTPFSVVGGIKRQVNVGVVLFLFVMYSWAHLASRDSWCATWGRSVRRC